MLPLFPKSFDDYNMVQCANRDVDVMETIIDKCCGLDVRKHTVVDCVMSEGSNKRDPDFQHDEGGLISFEVMVV